MPAKLGATSVTRMISKPHSISNKVMAANGVITELLRS